MTSDGGPPREFPTPPAFVRQLEREQHEISARHSGLRSLVQTNHLATLHEIGQLATGVMSNSAAIAEVRAELVFLTKGLERMEKLVEKLSLHLGVTS